MARRKIQTTETIIDAGVNDAAFIPLDRSRIIDTALQLLNEVGLRELSMRKLADSLGVKAAALYYHVKHKDELLELIADKISMEMSWPDASVHWEHQIRGWALGFRRLLNRYKDAVDIFNASIATGYNRLLQVERLLQILVAAGFHDAEVSWIAAMLKNYVTGYVAEEARLTGQANRNGEQVEQLGEKVHQAYSALPKDVFPNLIRLSANITSSDWDREFQFGLQILLDGLSTRLSNNHGNGRRLEVDEH